MRINFPSVLAASRTLAITSVEIVLKYARLSAYIPTTPADFYIQSKGATSLASTARFALYAVTKSEHGSESGMQIDFDMEAFARDYDAGEILSIEVNAYRFFIPRPKSDSAFNFSINLKEREFDRYEYALDRYNPNVAKYKTDEYLLHGDKWKKMASAIQATVIGLPVNDVLNYREARRVTESMYPRMADRVWTPEQEIERIKALRGHMVPVEDNPAWDEGAGGAWEAISITSGGELQLLRVQDKTWGFDSTVSQSALRSRLFFELSKFGRDGMAEHVSRELRLESTMYLSEVPIGAMFRPLTAMYDAPIKKVNRQYYLDLVEANIRSQSMTNPLVRVLPAV